MTENLRLAALKKENQESDGKRDLKLGGERPTQLHGA